MVRDLPFGAGASEDQKTCVFQIIHRYTPTCVCRVDSYRRQVSWLADRRFARPSRKPGASSG